MTEPQVRTPVFVPPVQPSPRAAGVAVRLDVLAWVGLVAVAFALRLARLDALPLTLDESRRALDVLLVSNNNVPAGWDGDLSAVATSYLFRVFEDTEFVARVAPAVAGAAMAAAVWLCCRPLGRTGALVAAALLAFSPLAVLMSRSAMPFSAGGLLAVAMTAALFSYLARPGAPAALLLAATFGLSLSSDVVGVTAALAVLAFLVLEPLLVRGSAVAPAWGVFIGSPAHYVSAGMALAASAELGLTHFGTTLDRLGLTGLTLWGGMFDLPRDGREPEYQALLLLLYDWPVLLAGGAGLAYFGWRVLRRGVRSLTSVQWFILIWVAVAAAVLAAATQREAGQLLMVILPLALLAGIFVEDVLPALDWSSLGRLWPVAAAILGMIAYAGLLATESSSIGISTPEQAYLALAAGGATALLVACLVLWGRGGGVVLATVAVALTAVFLAHTNLGFVRNDEAVELAVGLRSVDEIERFRETVELIVASREAPVAVDPALREPLAWYLRDLPVSFSPVSDQAGAAIVPAGREVEGFTELGGPWRLAEGWYPVDLQWRPLWRWLLYREPYSEETIVDAQILVPAP